MTFIIDAKKICHRMARMTEEEADALDEEITNADITLKKIAAST